MIKTCLLALSKVHPPDYGEYISSNGCVNRDNVGSHQPPAAKDHTVAGTGRRK